MSDIGTFSIQLTGLKAAVLQLALQRQGLEIREEDAASALKTTGSLSGAATLLKQRGRQQNVMPLGAKRQRSDGQEQVGESASKAASQVDLEIQLVKRCPRSEIVVRFALGVLVAIGALVAALYVAGMLRYSSS